MPHYKDLQVNLFVLNNAFFFLQCALQIYKEHITCDATK